MRESLVTIAEPDLVVTIADNTPNIKKFDPKIAATALKSHSKPGADSRPTATPEWSRSAGFCGKSG